MTTTYVPKGSDAPGLLPRVRSFLADYWRTYTLWHDRQRAIAALQRLDDRLLKDIGLARSEIKSAVHAGRRGRPRSRAWGRIRAA